jgi:hypothetical protein
MWKCGTFLFALTDGRNQYPIGKRPLVFENKTISMRKRIKGRN